MSASSDQVWNAHDASSLVRPCLALNLGITGHRPNRLPADVTPIRAQLSHVLQRIRAELVALAAKGQFAKEPPLLRLIDSLALGADVLAAETALDLGLELDACLPFERAEYARDFAEIAERDHFDALLGRASRVIELPGSRAAENAAYEAAGMTMLSLCDLVIAVWDGERAAGPGGTAEIVARAVDDNVAVIHIPTDPAGAVEIVWAGLSDAPAGRQSMWMAPRFAFDDNVAQLVAILCTPPDAPELPLIAAALDVPPARARIAGFGWPLLLRLFGARGAVAAVVAEEAPAEPGPAAGFANEAFAARFATHLAPLTAAADRSATVYGLRHRSGFVFNFVLAALAVLLAASSIVLHDLDKALVKYCLIGEIALIALILLNTWQGTRAEWHGKWLQMRHLAEWTRVLHFALPLGEPLLRFDGEDPARLNWLRWRTRAAARAAGIPAMAIGPELLTAMRGNLLAVIHDQLGYHRRNAHQMERMDHRTHLTGTCIFVFSIALAGWHLWHSMAGEEKQVDHLADVMTMLGVALPAFGSAIYGIRLQGNFADLTQRSRRMAEQLEGLARSIEAGELRHDLVSGQVRQLATIMLRDTADWRLTFEGRPLALPS